MKSLLLALIIFPTTQAFASECQVPSQGHLEMRLKENFHATAGERELKEWMIHPSNSEVRNNLKELDRRIKFTPQRLEREVLQDETQIKFEQAIMNTGRPSEMDNFPAAGTNSKVSSSKGALTLEMTNLQKEDLDVFPKEILDKIEPKVKINYYYPYDKFEYLLTYDGKEQPMNVALLRVQKDMEVNCERRMIENQEYRHWYKESRKIEASTGSGRGLQPGRGAPMNSGAQGSASKGNSQ
jgi:hypothetical protein